MKPFNTISFIKNTIEGSIIERESDLEATSRVSNSQLYMNDLV